MTLHNDSADLDIYVSAGFATASNFLDNFADALALRYEQSGRHVRVHVHFPYGDWDRSKRRQLQEIVRDAWHLAHRKKSVHGGKNLAQFVLDTMGQGGKLLFIGHSAGAVAAVLAAEELDSAGRDVLGVIQIGSPKCAIPAALKPKVLCIQATNQQNQRHDPISRLGTWGGWRRTRLGLFRWHSRKHAPIHQRILPLIGGHADYFRDHAPYIWQASTNLQTTMNTIWTWLQTIEKDVEHD
ncbi:hypothetical protein A8709_26965 [Paenibacillus pectinilyticus]|uniref:Fungal lipase-like domain-containing protein n=1 Tax=Paenibacillus pectinilyticus TaxID=512399 RepID=A0A1C1A1X8_9BACL|nr:hypothetical protein [Paenibacillus pectinilyticus]OCT14450.1 hypothetical protein A8709_26965 [Paenibacillus pectinilyticus]